MELIRAKPEDIDLYLEIENYFFNSKTYSIFTNRNEIAQEISGHVMYFIKNDEVIIGRVSYKFQENGDAYLSDLVIIPSFQNQGFGKKVLNKILNEIGKKRITLIVHPDSKNAVKLYESFGFVIEKRVENYFGDGEPRVVMAKTA